MRIKILVITFCCLTMIMSCTKNNTAPTSGPGGFWSFDSNTYPAISCVVDSSSYTLTASTSVTGSTYGNMVVYFYNSLPDTGSYTIVEDGNLSAHNQAAISLTYQTSAATTYYTSAITYNKDQQPYVQKIKVTKTNGKLGISGTAISVASIATATDTVPLTFSITQTQ
jgi:hypothetical protein